MDIRGRMDIRGTFAQVLNMLSQVLAMKMSQTRTIYGHIHSRARTCCSKHLRSTRSKTYLRLDKQVELRRALYVDGCQILFRFVVKNCYASNTQPA